MQQEPLNKKALSLFYELITIMKWLVLLPIFFLLAILLLALLIFAFTQTNKAYWDYKVTRWCEKDGGVTVYQKIELTQEEYKRNGGRNGRISIGPKDHSKENEEYAYTMSTKIIHQSNPRVRRSKSTTYRKSDGKILGIWVTYSRVGGDFPIALHASHFSCQDISKHDSQAEIFSIKGD